MKGTYLIAYYLTCPSVVNQSLRRRYGSYSRADLCQRRGDGRLDFQVDPKFQCVLEVIIPLGLPRFIDPSIPPPPYRGEDELFDRLLKRVRLVTTTILAGLLTSLMGKDYPLHSVLGFDPFDTDFNIVQGRDWIENFDAHAIKSMRDLVIGPDLHNGHWIDQFEIRRQGNVDAFYEDSTGLVSLITGFKYILILGPFKFVEEQLRLKNPRMIQFKAADELEDGKVVFVAKEYTEKARFHKNQMLETMFQVQEPCIRSGRL